MSLGFGRKATVALAGAVAFLLGITAVSYFTTARLSSDNRRIARQLRLRTEAESLFSIVKDAEIGQSGYVLTGDRQFFRAFQSAVFSFPGKVEALGRLIGNDPGQRLRLTRAADLVERRFQMLNRNLETVHSREELTAKPESLARTGQQAIGQFGAVLNEIVNNENTRLEGDFQAERITVRWSFGSIVLADAIAFVLLVTSGATISQQIILRQRAAKDREQLLTQLQEALTKVKILRGLLPVCAACKKIRDRSGNWQQMESYISDHSEAEFSHGICPDCLKSLYPQFSKDL